MDSLPEPEALVVKAMAAARAVWRVSAANRFDATLKHALRTHAAEITSGVASLPSYTGRPRRERRERLVAASAGIGALLTLAHTLGFVTPENAFRISEAYQWIAQHLPSPAAEGGTQPLAAQWGDGRKEVNERQRRILEHLSESGRAQIGEMRSLFGSAVSEKTLRRDLWQLVSTGYIRRQGDKRWATYISIGH